MDGKDETPDVFDRALRQLTDNKKIQQDVQKALRELLGELPESRSIVLGPNANFRPQTKRGRPGNNPSSLVAFDIDDDQDTVENNPTLEHAPEGREATNPRTPPALRFIAKDQERLGRFYNLGLIGEGGMGEVYRVRDPDLNRRMVLKVIRPSRIHDRTAITRFLEEAQLTSQLHHPGIVPVHELGILDDGRLYFTMREVRGRTLTEVIDECHTNFRDSDPDERAWNAHFHNLINIFSRACEPVAYAHSRGIIHRDLKPSNIMVGDFGEVQIIDWGLAKLVDRHEPTGLDDVECEITSIRASITGFDTLRGSIVGTPVFMPPEQARGALDDMGPRSDVYALGAILAMVLDGEPPYSGNSTSAVLFQVIEGLNHVPGRELDAPEDLIDLCLRSMSLDPADRPIDATAFADAISDWRDGSNRRKRALALVETADEHTPQFESLRQRAQALREESRQILQKIPPSAPLAQKRPAWSLEEDAEILDREAGTHRASAVKCLERALSHVPDFEEAHRRLVSIYRHEHAEAERRRDLPRADALEVYLRSHNTGEFDAYLAGLGRLSLYTSPPGARVTLFRYIRRDRQRIPGLERVFGHTPIADANLPMGSYLFEIEASGRVPVRYPVYIGRQQTWTGSPPGAEELFRVHLPFIGEIDDDEIYVPGSSYWSGGDEQATNSPPRSICWVDPFIIQKHPVSHAAYLEFLNDLIDQGREDEAQRHSPKSSGKRNYGGATAIYLRCDNGRFRPHNTSKSFLKRPVNLIDWHSARAFARWYSEKTGRRWRLPRTDEWEKAARGVGGRFYPWGDFLDPIWCCMVDSRVDAGGPVSIDAYPDDVSPYGMHGAAGNIRDWVLPDDVDDLDDIDDSTPVPFRGGCWFSTAAMCRLATREFARSDSRSQGTGFRLARDHIP